ncbi:MAG: molybdopterin adenylyltransferase [Desulfuromonas sp.]|nr:molybdopterin adenylyltransferase [Desulfuromonas sp.]
MKAAVLILSDKGAAGEREDLSGPALINWLSQQDVETVRYEMIPDDFDIIVATLTNWADDEFCQLIITCGGTGVSPRDVTPEATLQVVDRTLPGFGELMRAESLKITPMAILSRAMAGIRGKCLIINLPGSPKAALENLEAVWAAIPHAVDKICGDKGDCADLYRQIRESKSR